MRVHPVAAAEPLGDFYVFFNAAGTCTVVATIDETDQLEAAESTTSIQVEAAPSQPETEASGDPAAPPPSAPAAPSSPPPAMVVSARALSPETVTTALSESPSSPSRSRSSVSGLSRDSGISRGTTRVKRVKAAAKVCRRKHGHKRALCDQRRVSEPGWG